MNEVQRNELFKAYLLDCIDKVNQKTTFEQRTGMINNLDAIHTTNNLQTAFKAIRNELKFL